MKYLFFTFIYFVTIFFPKDYIYGGSLLEETPPTQIDVPRSPLRVATPVAPLSPMATPSPLRSGDRFPTPTRTQATVTAGQTSALNAEALKTPARQPKTWAQFSSPRGASPVPPAESIPLAPSHQAPDDSMTAENLLQLGRTSPVFTYAGSPSLPFSNLTHNLVYLGYISPVFPHADTPSQILSFHSSYLAEAQSHLSGQASVTTEETDHVVGVPAGAGSGPSVGNKRSRDEAGSRDGAESDAISYGIVPPPAVKRDRLESSNGTNANPKNFSALRSDSDSEDDDDDLPMSPTGNVLRMRHKAIACSSPARGPATDSVMRAAALASQTSFGSSSLLPSPHSTNSSIRSAELDLPQGLVDKVIKEYGCIRSVAYAIAKKRYMNQPKGIDRTPARHSNPAAGGAGKPSPIASITDPLDHDSIEDSQDEAAAPFAPTTSSPIVPRRYQPLSLVPSNGITTSGPLAGRSIPLFTPVLIRAVAPTTPSPLRADPIEFTPDADARGSLPLFRRSVVQPLKLLPATSRSLAPAAAPTFASPYNPFLDHARRIAALASTPSSQASSASRSSKESLLSSPSRASIASDDSEEARRNILQELIAAEEAEGNLAVGADREAQLAELHEEADDIFERERAVKAERRAFERARAQRLAEEERAMSDIERHLNAFSRAARKERDEALAAEKELKNQAFYAAAREQVDKEIALKRAEEKVASCQAALEATKGATTPEGLLDVIRKDLALRTATIELLKHQLEYQAYLASHDKAFQIEQQKMKLKLMADFEPEQYSALWNMKGWISDPIMLEAMTQLEEAEVVVAMDRARARALAEAAEHKEAMEALARHAALKAVEGE